MKHLIGIWALMFAGRLVVEWAILIKDRKYSNTVETVIMVLFILSAWAGLNLVGAWG